MSFRSGVNWCLSQLHHKIRDQQQGDIRNVIYSFRFTESRESVQVSIIASDSSICQEFHMCNVFYVLGKHIADFH